MSVQKNVAEHFFGHYINAPGDPALFVDEKLYLYGELAAGARAVAGYLESLNLRRDVRLGWWPRARSRPTPHF